MRSFLVRVAVFGAFILVVLELFFTHGLPASTRPRSIHDAQTGLVRFDVSWLREGVISHGALCREPSRWRLNGAGMNSIFEYRTREERDRPLIAILGDSFAEGFLSDVEDHFDARLHELYGGEVDVYVFGHSGAHMAQYVAMSEEIERIYAPDVFVYVMHGDIDHAADSRIPHYYAFVETDSGFVLERPRVHYQQSRAGRYVFRSALMRYLYLNNQLIPAQNAIAMPDVGPFHKSVPEDLSRYLAAGRYALDRLAAIAPGKPKVFVCDTPLAEIYAGQEDLSRNIDYHVLREICPERPDCHQLDLAPAYRASWEQHGEPFSPEFDPHWNAHGNRVVARAIRDFLRERRLLPAADESRGEA